MQTFEDPIHGIIFSTGPVAPEKIADIVKATLVNGGDFLRLRTSRLEGALMACVSSKIVQRRGQKGENVSVAIGDLSSFENQELRNYLAWLDEPTEVENDWKVRLNKQRLLLRLLGNLYPSLHEFTIVGVYDPARKDFFINLLQVNEGHGI